MARANESCGDTEGGLESESVVLRRLTTLPASTHSKLAGRRQVAPDRVAYLDAPNFGIERRNQRVAERLGETKPPGALACIVEGDNVIVDAHAGRSEAFRGWTARAGAPSADSACSREPVPASLHVAGTVTPCTSREAATVREVGLGHAALDRHVDAISVDGHLVAAVAHVRHTGTRQQHRAHHITEVAEERAARPGAPPLEAGRPDRRRGRDLDQA